MPVKPIEYVLDETDEILVTRSQIEGRQGFEGVVFTSAEQMTLREALSKGCLQSAREAVAYHIEAPKKPLSRWDFVKGIADRFGIEVPEKYDAQRIERIHDLKELLKTVHFYKDLLEESDHNDEAYETAAREYDEIHREKIQKQIQDAQESIQEEIFQLSRNVHETRYVQHTRTVAVNFISHGKAFTAYDDSPDAELMLLEPGASKKHPLVKKALARAEKTGRIQGMRVFSHVMSLEEMANDPHVHAMIGPDVARDYAVYLAQDEATEVKVGQVHHPFIEILRWKGAGAAENPDAQQEALIKDIMSKHVLYEESRLLQDRVTVNYVRLNAGGVGLTTYPLGDAKKWARSVMSPTGMPTVQVEEPGTDIRLKKEYATLHEHGLLGPLMVLAPAIPIIYGGLTEPNYPALAIGIAYAGLLPLCYRRRLEKAKKRTREYIEQFQKWPETLQKWHETLGHEYTESKKGVGDE